MDNGYADHLTIERRDPTKDYCPDNCHWACTSEQQSNKRKRKGSASKFIGVAPNHNNWTAKVQYKGVTTYLGTFTDPEEAARVRDAFVVENSLPHRLNF